MSYAKITRCVSCTVPSAFRLCDDCKRKAQELIDMGYTPYKIAMGNPAIIEAITIVLGNQHETVDWSMSVEKGLPFKDEKVCR